MLTTKVAKAPYECLWSFACEGAVISVAMTPNGFLIVAGAVDRKLYLFRRDGKLLWKRILDNEVWGVSISSSSGNCIAAGTANKNPAEGMIYVFNREGKRVFQYNIGSPV